MKFSEEYQKISEHRLTGSQLRLYLALKELADKDGKVKMSSLELSKLIGFTKAMVTVNLCGLITAGLVEKKVQLKENGASDANEYKVKFRR